MRIHVVINPNARRFAERPALVDRMIRIASGRARVHVTDTLSDLTTACRDITSAESDVVFFSGGDGTFMAGLSELSRLSNGKKLPKIGLLPGGTVATVARNWGISEMPDRVLQRFLSTPQLPTVQRPTLRVRAHVGSSVDERLGFIFGTGLVASFFDVYYSEGARGYMGAARIVGRIFIESFYGGNYARRVLDPLPCRIIVDTRELSPNAWSLICCSAVRNLGLHMLLTYRAGEDLERPHLVATPLPCSELGPRAPFVLAGYPIGGRDHVDTLVRQFRVEFPGEDGPFVLDGERLRARCVEISAGPVVEALTLSE